MKLKTKRTLFKRMKLTAGGKVRRKRVRTSHLKVKWSSSEKHRKARPVGVTKAFEKRFKRMLG